MNLKTTKLKDLPAWFREKLDCDAELKIKLEAIQLLKKAVEMAIQRLEAFSNAPGNAIRLAEKEMEVYERYLLLTEESIKLVNNMEITFAEQVELAKKFNSTEIEILEDHISIAKSVNRHLTLITFGLESGNREFTEIPLLPPEERS